MLGTNKAQLKGAVVRSTLTKRGESQTPVFEATIAMTSSANGRDVTAYVPVYAIGKVADRLFENTSTGSIVHLDGVVRQEKWGEAGARKSRTRILALRSEVIADGELIADSGGNPRLADGVNTVVLGGNLVGPAELRTVRTGDLVGDFSLALNNTFVNGKGEKVETVDFVDVIAWRQLAEKVKDLAKGTPLLVEGVATSESWTDKNGQKRSALKFTATRIDVVVVPTKVQGAQQEDVQAAPVAQAAPVNAPGADDLDAAYPDFPAEEDLPF